jgi:hypothetical protein
MEPSQKDRRERRNKNYERKIMSTVSYRCDLLPGKMRKVDLFIRKTIRLGVEFILYQTDEMEESFGAEMKLASGTMTTM